MVVIWPFFIKYFTSKDTIGVTIFPFIILKSKLDKQIETLVFHERIHIRQQLEMLILLFYIWYLVEFLIKWLQYKDSKLAYRNISFEREAYGNENNFNYLRKRNFWNFIHYL
ncbi:MAG TPA: hypothetical protein PLC61_00905 [Chitinophagales bacterium]|nr:hypothetical protein [Chitinophagales bacterium]MCB0514270.1 hypothetical protein [Bacteroidota bacterium]MCB9075205.1 hypothetical protein [Chitinophagales bacterium]HMU97979.1 hypothetical protein [Chitinophagales bacterium]HMV02259.1 hypothetical protein [Chitinophagales bacterium]